VGSESATQRPNTLQKPGIHYEKDKR
jgi:hypothetical protein